MRTLFPLFLLAACTDLMPHTERPIAEPRPTGVANPQLQTATFALG